jgi:hypothetical protein
VSAQDNTPAFPAGWPESNYEPHYGMSQRDWFAGQAFGAVMGSARALEACSKDERAEMFSRMAQIIYEATDAMLAESKKGGTQ